MSAIQLPPLSSVFDIELLLQPVLFSSGAESQNYTDAQPPTLVATTTHACFLTPLLQLSTDSQAQPRDSKRFILKKNIPHFNGIVLSMSW